MNSNMTPVVTRVKEWPKAATQARSQAEKGIWAFF